MQGLLVLLMLAFAAPMLTACGGDDDEPETPNSIVGVWKCVKNEKYDAATGIYYDFPFSTWYGKYVQNGAWEQAEGQEMTNVTS